MAPLLVCLMFLPLVAQAATGKAQAKKDDLPPLDIMLGSMLMVGFHGTALVPGDPLLKAVESGHLGHVILFSKKA